jgi:UDPglucose--hexose-1-phosphate uridylyltransferase
MTLDWMKWPHRRLNRLTGEWVIVSAQRAMRPWQGQVETTTESPSLRYDPNCYLCPGNARAGGVRNPNYESTFVFDNDFPALLPETSTGSLNERDLLIAQSEPGICRVVCFSPRHDLSISQMDQPAVAKVVDTWCDQDRELAAFPFVRYVQIFENRGAMMGASNPHPHGQIWASASIPNEILKEQVNQNAYFEKHASCLLCDYVSAEQNGERIVCANAGFIAMVPFWAVWPYEILVVSRRHFGGMQAMTLVEREQLADILRRITGAYDGVFCAPFPYSMGLHQQPVGQTEQAAWHWHAHYLPPLLRGATIRKFMAGYELLATPQRDVTPEWAADRLRSVAR